MQPVYLTGHSRPVRKVMYNSDGDLLFTCSDDGNICMYNTYDCSRVGVFNVKEAIKSMDVTKDSKHVLAAGTTFGFVIFNSLNGEELQRVTIPVKNIQTKHVEFALGDQKFLIVYDHNKRSYVRIYDFKSALLGKNTEGEKEIVGPLDHIITQASWGPLNKTVYISTDKGRFLIHDIESDKVVVQSELHKSEIFSFTVTYDHTMIITCGKDGHAKLIHPKTLVPVRVFDFVKPCRNACISPLFDSTDLQKFHVLLAGGQDAREVTTTQATEGGFSIKLMSMIFNQNLADITGHFGTVHTLAFSPDGFTFASGSEDGYVHFHKLLHEYFTKKFE